MNRSLENQGRKSQFCNKKIILYYFFALEILLLYANKATRI